MTDYISKVFRDKGLEPIIGERFSRRAGQVEHLCTPISLKVGSANGRLAEILSVLHPTPAVGIPKNLRWNGFVE